MSKVFVYPKLNAKADVGIRIGGSGLANSLFTFSRAYIYAEKHSLRLINPTWRKLSIGPYIRKEKDKRHYFNLFKPVGITGAKKYFVLKTYAALREPESTSVSYSGIETNSVIVFEGLKNFFADIYGYNSLLRNIILEKINRKYIERINNYDFNNTVGLHIRLGDFNEKIRTPFEWYMEMIKNINSSAEQELKYLLFSDGSDKELGEILSIKNVERIYFGSAISDILALSRCKLIIGSNSSFSGWGSYLGKVPSVFYRKDFGNIFNDGTCEITIKDSGELPLNLFEKLSL